MADFSKWQRCNLESVATGLTKERLAHVATIQEMKAALQLCLMWLEDGKEAHGSQFGLAYAVDAAKKALQFKSLDGKSP
jgi:hypothetical protein